MKKLKWSQWSKRSSDDELKSEQNSDEHLLKWYDLGFVYDLVFIKIRKTLNWDD